MKIKISWILGLPLAALVLYLFFYPVAIDPVPFIPPANPGLEGVFAKNNKLGGFQKLLVGDGPEDITQGPDGNLYSGLKDGRVVVFSKEGNFIRTFVQTGGRPLGLAFDQKGNLIIADEYKGLLSADKNGKIEVLADNRDPARIFFADGLAIGQDGRIWFSDANKKFKTKDLLFEFLELQPAGRLLSYDPVTRKVQVEMDSLRFANGVTFGPGEAYVLVSAMIGMRIHKLWLKGPKKGQREVFMEELPGYPDNMWFDGRNTFWIALAGVRSNKVFEATYPYPFLRKVMLRLPSFLLDLEKEQPRVGMIIGVDTTGKVTHNLQDHSGNSSFITSVKIIDGNLYFGSSKMKTAGKIELNL